MTSPFTTQPNVRTIQRPSTRGRTPRRRTSSRVRAQFPNALGSMPPPNAIYDPSRRRRRAIPSPLAERGVPPGLHRGHFMNITLWSNTRHSTVGTYTPLLPSCDPYLQAPAAKCATLLSPTPRSGQVGPLSVRCRRSLKSGIWRATLTSTFRTSKRSSSRGTNARSRATGAPCRLAGRASGAGARSSCPGLFLTARAPRHRLSGPPPRAPHCRAQQKLGSFIRELVSAAQAGDIRDDRSRRKPRELQLGPPPASSILPSGCRPPLVRRPVRGARAYAMLNIRVKDEATRSRSCDDALSSPARDRRGCRQGHRHRAASPMSDGMLRSPRVRFGYVSRCGRCCAPGRRSRRDANGLPRGHISIVIREPRQRLHAIRARAMECALTARASGDPRDRLLTLSPFAFLANRYLIARGGNSRLTPPYHR